MACTKQWFNLTGAGLSTIGAGILTAGSAATVQWYVTAGGVIVTLGGLAWAISAIMDLADCYEAHGRSAEAQQLRDRAQKLQEDYNRLEALVS
ncbi:MAG TPA: hypothetical protein VFV67_36250 [Actinophytocola sp.]|uniref:hypothetical protein n=1 Tax=Actinophytocola sp. TaxID=1872138 RepID=UPI002DC02804|nr:hypothetical protein [Actinophytocola sp.]HEU5476110.1 hypothetical protein [Actinophytocola sp.]